jgi:uncharacterized protein YkwD
MGSPRRRLGRLSLLTLAVSAFAFPAGATAAPPCRVDQPASTETLCWLNAARAAHGRAALRRDPRLEQAAEQHSRDMVASGYFEHDTRGGGDFTSRIAATGWMRRHPEWRVGETLAWGSGALAAPAAIVQAWLNSPPHRRILFSARFNVVGIGVAPGTPTSVPDGVTATADFGS